jgi:hypothetical protein
MRNASEQKCSYKLPLNPAGVINSGERSGHWIKLRVTGIFEIQQNQGLRSKGYVIPRK